jgi:hypothetical protein
MKNKIFKFSASSQNKENDNSALIKSMLSKNEEEIAKIDRIIKNRPFSAKDKNNSEIFQSKSNSKKKNENSLNEEIHNFLEENNINSSFPDDYLNNLMSIKDSQKSHNKTKSFQFTDEIKVQQTLNEKYDSNSLKNPNNFFCSPRFNLENCKVKSKDDKLEQNTFTLNDKPMSSEKEKFDFCFIENENEKSLNPDVPHNLETSQKLNEERINLEKNVRLITNSSSKCLKNNSNRFADISEIYAFDKNKGIEYEECNSFNEKSESLEAFQKNETDNKVNYNDENRTNEENENESYSFLLFELKKEQEKNSFLEEKLHKKEVLIEEMKDFHKELCTALRETQKELEKQKGSYEISMQEKENIKLLMKENIDMKNEFKIFSDNYEKMQSEIDYLQGELEKKDQDIERDNSEIEALKNEMEELIKILKQKEDQIEEQTLENKNLLSQINNWQNQDKSKYFSRKMDTTLENTKMDFNESAFNHQDQQDKLKKTGFIKTLKENINQDNINELILFQKKTKNFVKNLTEMVVRLSPEGYFNETPDLRTIWRFLKKIMEDYMKLRNDTNKFNTEREKILAKVMRMINVREIEEILPTLEKVIQAFVINNK